MHRETKRQILDLLTTLEEAISYLQRNPENNKEGLLRDCSLCAKSIVATLHKDSEAHEKHVHLLAQFTEKIKQAQKQIGDLHAFQQALSAAKVKLAFLRRKMEKLATKLEVVFLPYKASMWDSLESIWRAANADPDCDAYVVPIPYYDLNPDHTPAKFHYEGDLYPEDVPVTDYRKYDLPARRPDVIYIHNPYDGCNRVTSVEPAYYSDRLKKYTEMLVYVPYDVVMDGISEHMCQMPGVQNADRVIVQSEKIKQIYAKYMPEEKVLALGSPKIDKVLWTQEHPPAMPEEWARIARGRKLILYNTHLSSLIVDDENACRKLRYVFSEFKGRDDVCLLWRPHPLSEATLQAMNPKALREYVSLVESYRKEGLGIYDDSPDMHRAIALSVAYYGDWGSLVPMFGVTGKPIMIQHMEVYGEDYTEENRHFSFLDAAFDGDNLWFSPYCYNGIFKMDLRTEEVTFMTAFPGEKASILLYQKTIKIENKIYFIPAEANDLAEFDLNSHIVLKHSLPLEEKEKGDSHVYRFLTAFVWNEYIWMVPFMEHSIVRFDVKTGGFTYYDKWRTTLEKLSPINKEYDFCDAICVKDEIWALIFQSKLLLRFNMRTQESVVYSIVSDETYFTSLIYREGKIWILPISNRNFIVWDVESHESETIPFLESTKEAVQNLYKRCLCFDKYIWLFPAMGEKIIRFDIENKRIDREVEYPEGFTFFLGRRGYGEKFGSVVMQDRNIVAFPYRANMMLMIKEDLKIKGIPVCNSKKVENKEAIVYREDSENPYIGLWCIENSNYAALNMYLDSCFVVNENLRKRRGKLYQNVLGTPIHKCGERIHEHIKLNIFNVLQIKN